MQLYVLSKADLATIRRIETQVKSERTTSNRTLF